MIELEQDIKLILGEDEEIFLKNVVIEWLE
jgi:hypothetical protein